MAFQFFITFLPPDYSKHTVIHVVGMTFLEFMSPAYDFVLTVRPRNRWQGVLDTTLYDKGCP